MTAGSHGFDGIERRGLMFVLSSPSGAGKTTLSRLLIERLPGLKMSVSATTRPMRPGGVDGRDSLFVNQTHFKEMVKRHQLLEWATVFDNSDGAPRAPVEAALSSGQDVLFDIDWQGTQQLREKARADVVSVFILPPSAADLEKRLHTRAQDSDAVTRGRMSRPSHEMSHWAEYDYIVINHDIDAAFAEVQSILNAERLKPGIPKRCTDVGLQPPTLIYTWRPRLTQRADQVAGSRGGVPRRSGKNSRPVPPPACSILFVVSPFSRSA